MIDKLISKDIVFYYVSKDDGLCDNRVMADNMTNETGGEYYNYTESGGVEDIIMKIAGAIVNITYAEQTAVVTGNLTTKLYPDSYIEFDYEEQEVPYGLIITSEEEFDDDYSGHFSIPENSTIIETNAISYSGSRWTDNVNINDISVYNLSSYGSVYMELGDPYSINIPSSLIQENNEIKITTGLSPTNSTSGSEHNKIIYKIMKDITAYSEISAIAEGCIWNIQFEDDTNLTANIPKNYSGTDNCYYQSGRQELTNENDAIQTAVYNLLKLLDFDSNGKSDVKFIEQNFEIGFFGVVDIPYSWSTEVKVIRWD